MYNSRGREREKEKKAGRGKAGKASDRKMREGTALGPSAPIQLYFSIINAYIVTFVNGEVSEGRWMDNAC